MMDLAARRASLPVQLLEAEDMGESLGSPNSKLEGDAGLGWFTDGLPPVVHKAETPAERDRRMSGTWGAPDTPQTAPGVNNKRMVAEPLPGVFSDNRNLTETGDNRTAFNGNTEYSMFTFNYGNGLTAGAAGSTASAKLSDSVEAVEYHANTGPTNTQVASPDAYAAPEQYEQSAQASSGGGGLLGNYFGNPAIALEDSQRGSTVRRETMLFIFGAILLALGIYALVK